MAIDTSFVLGYGSIAKISIVSLGTATATTYGTSYLSLLSGSIERRLETGFATSYHIPFSDAKRSKIKLNEGTYTFSGNISFELTSSLAGNILDVGFLSGRKKMFNLTIYDGMYTVNMPQCIWQNISINGDPNGAVTCSISFMSLNAYQKDIKVTNTRAITAVAPDALQPYWKYGSSNGTSETVESFSLTFSRNVTPVFLNNDWLTPSYMRVGILDVELNINCLEKWFDLSEITLGSKTLTFNNDFVVNNNWQFSGMSGEGVKSFTIKGSNSATDDVFTLS